MTDTLVMAGGGTGGHVYPMVAVAHAVRRLRPDVRLVFVGTERGMETRVVPAEGFELELLQVLPIRGGGVSGAVKGIVQAARTIPASRELLRKVADDPVLLKRLAEAQADRLAAVWTAEALRAQLQGAGMVPGS